MQSSTRKQARCESAQEHTIAELIDIVNLEPRRGVGHEKVLTRLELDAQAQTMLAAAGLKADAVPAAGQTVYLRSTANLSTGGTATDVNDVIHPFGGICNRYYNTRLTRRPGQNVERDLVALRQKLCFETFAPPIDKDNNGQVRGKSVGISRSFLTHSLSVCSYRFLSAARTPSHFVLNLRSPRPYFM